MQTDFIVGGGGTIYTLLPLTEAAQNWVTDHLPEDAQTLWRNICIEHRYIGDIVQGIINDGLTVE